MRGLDFLLNIAPSSGSFMQSIGNGFKRERGRGQTSKRRKKEENKWDIHPALRNESCLCLCSKELT